MRIVKSSDGRSALRVSKDEWIAIAQENGWVGDRTQQASQEDSEENLTWKQIEDKFDPDGKNHDLTLICTKCNRKSTCRCSKPKKVHRGVCEKCSGDGSPF